MVRVASGAVTPFMGEGAAVTAPPEGIALFIGMAVSPFDSLDEDIPECPAKVTKPNAALAAIPVFTRLPMP